MLTRAVISGTTLEAKFSGEEVGYFGRRNKISRSPGLPSIVTGRYGCAHNTEKAFSFRIKDPGSGALHVINKRTKSGSIFRKVYQRRNYVRAQSALRINHDDFRSNH